MGRHGWRQAWPFVLGLLSFNGLVFAVAQWEASQSLARYEHVARAHAENLSQVIAHEIQDTLETAQQSLRLVAQDAALASQRQRLDQAAWRVMSRRYWLEADEAMDTALVQDLGGVRTVIHGATSSLLDLLPPDLSDELPVFFWHAPSSSWFMALSATLPGQSNQRVVGIASLAMLAHAFAGVETGGDSVVALLDDEGRLLWRQLGVSGADAAAVGPEPNPALRDWMQRVGSLGSAVTPSPLDGVERSYAYRKLAEVPINLGIGLSLADYLASWQQEVGRIVLVAALLGVLSLVYAGFVLAAQRRDRRAAQTLSQTQRRLDEERKFNHTILSNSPFAIYTRDVRGRVTSWNPAAERLFGWSAEEILGQELPSAPPGKVEECHDLQDRVLAGESFVELELRRKKRDGSLFDLSATLAPLKAEDGTVQGYLAIANDLSERKAAQQRIEFLAYRDALTGLPNRQLLQDRCSQAMAHAERTGQQLALLVMDLDHFKTVNDSLGHGMGDRLLLAVASRLKLAMRETDTLSRLGGDEFVLLLPDLESMGDVMPVLNKVMETMAQTFEIEGQELSSAVSMGAALYPHDGRDFDTLLKKADTAMYQAKRDGRGGYCFFDQLMQVRAVEHLQIGNGLRKALHDDELELHYQPQFCLDTGRVIGVEALVRWRHPEQGLQLPARFIPLAEESGLIVPLGRWVLEEACRQGAAWHRAGRTDLMVAVNLSAAQLMRDDIVRGVEQALARSGFDPAHLELELTESILISDAEHVVQMVGRLKALGVKLAIDDFGTGYSSLAYLSRLQLDRLKIDRSFLSELQALDGDSVIIETIVQLARGMHLDFIAEGVETEMQLLRLRQLGCAQAQGYYLARPGPAAELDAYFQTPHRLCA